MSWVSYPPAFDAMPPDALGPFSPIHAQLLNAINSPSHIHGQ